MRNRFNNTCLAALLLFVSLSVSCGRDHQRAMVLIVVIDLTGSIPSDAQADAFAAVQACVRLLKRGDSLIVIPLTGDATTELPGRILRFHVDRRRKAYDEDLRQLATETRQKLETLQRRASENPAKITDLLGAMIIAGEEVRQQITTAKSENRDVSVRVLVLSDYIQDDQQANFKRDSRLANERAARLFASELAQRKPLALTGAELYLGLLRSDDLKTIESARRDAIRTFWTDYCSAAQPKSVRFMIDGPGQAEIFLRQNQEAD